jgi:hypothetical protein
MTDWDVSTRALTVLAMKPASDLTAKVLEVVLACTVWAARDVPSNAWHHRSLALVLAQVHEQAGNLAAAALAWLRVATLAPHRAGDAQTAARRLFLAAGHFDEWLRLTGNRAAPRMGPALAKSTTEHERTLVTTAIPLLERRFVDSPGAARVANLTHRELSALVELDLAPGGEAYLSAFPDDWGLDDVHFGGVLTLPPARPVGFFVDEVAAHEPSTSQGQALLARATRVERTLARVHAHWGATHAGPRERRVTPVVRAGTFEATVLAQLGPFLDGASGVAHFRGAPWSAIEALGAALGSDFLDLRRADRQEAAPSVRQLLEGTRGVSERTSFGGYVVFPPRPDARVSVDSVDTASSHVPAGWSASADEQTVSADRITLWWD